MNMMNDILQAHIGDFVSCYQDDMIAYRGSRAEHLRTVRKILESLRMHKLCATMSKCEFGCASVEFLGHFVASKGFEMERAKTESITMWPTPMCERDGRSILGMGIVYMRFVQDKPRIANPRTELTGDVEFHWAGKQDSAFMALRNTTCSVPVLTPLEPSIPALVSTAASGAVLEQDHGMGRRPVAHFSQNVNVDEQRSTIRERELLAIVEAIRHWRLQLHAWSELHHPLSVHESLRYQRTQDKLNDRQVRWLETLEHSVFRIESVPGAKNIVADALSRKVENAASRVEANAEVLNRVLPEAIPNHVTALKSRTALTKLVTPMESEAHKKPETLEKPQTPEKPETPRTPETSKDPETPEKHETPRRPNNHNNMPLNSLTTFKMPEEVGRRAGSACS